MLYQQGKKTRCVLKCLLALLSQKANATILIYAFNRITTSAYIRIQCGNESAILLL
jgi:hypothetical protein